MNIKKVSSLDSLVVLSFDELPQPASIDMLNAHASANVNTFLI